MLAKAGLLSAEECGRIEQALGEIRREIEEDRFPFRAELEDIHMHVEQALVERLGDVGRNSIRPAAATTRWPPTCGCGCAGQSTGSTPG